MNQHLSDAVDSINAASVEFETQTALVTSLNSKVSSLTAERDKAKADLTISSAELIAANAEITTLKARIAELEAGGSPTLPTVTPKAAGKVWRDYYMCTHPNFGTQVYKHVEETQERIALMNVYGIRGMYTGWNNAMTRRTVETCRKLGIKWNATIIPESGISHDLINKKVADIAANAADVVTSIEGQNEPNHNRDGSPVSSMWAANCVAYQKTLWEAVKSYPQLSHVKVLTPSLHDGVSSQATYNAMRDAGVLRYADVVGLHCYPGARQPDGEGKLNERLGWIKNAYGNLPVYVTESGYHTAMDAGPGVHKPAPEDVCAIYAPRALLQFSAKGVKYFRYELMDDPDAGVKDVHESNFGVFKVKTIEGSPDVEWTEKPEAGVMRTLLTSLEDVDNYTPKPVPLKVNVPATAPDVEWHLVGRSDGKNFLFIYRNKSIWNRDTKTRITVAPVAVKVDYRGGSKTVNVDATVQVLEIPA